MSGEPSGTTPRIGLPPELFAAAFPFHIAVDDALDVVQVGATLRRLCPDVAPGARLDRVFRSIRPDGPIGFEWVLRNRARFFLLEHLGSGLQLRGEFVAQPDSHTLVFLGSPWFTDAGEIAARGLGIDDFAIHDPVVDLLQVFQASKMALGDAKKLAAKLAAQRAELRLANDRLREKEAESRTLALVAARTDNAVVLTDASGRVVWVNEGFTRLTGYRLPEVIGRTPGSVLQGPATDPATVRRIAERLRRGEGFNVELANYRRDGRRYWVAIEVQPIFDEEGRVANFMAIESDITARRAEQQRLAIQSEVARILAEADDRTRALERVIEVICRRLGWRIGQFWRVSGGRLRFASTWHPAEGRVPEFVAASRARDFVPGEGVLGRAWATREPCWIADVTQDPDFLRADAARCESLRAAIAVPIVLRGETWGVLEFFGSEVEEPDGALLEAFAGIGGQIALFLVRREAEEALRDEKRLLEAARRRELETGKGIQRVLLIGEPAERIAGADIARYTEPSQVIDGDFHAFTTFRPDCFELLVGDVMGKGVPAALVGAAVRMAYNQVVTELLAGRLAAGVLPPPADIVNALHARLTPRLIELDTFVTLALYRFDLAERRLAFVNAGHTPGLLLRAESGIERILGENLPLGVLEAERYTEAARTLGPGDGLVVYSDGVTEARKSDGVEFGEERLRGLLESMRGLSVPASVCLQALRKRVREFTGGGGSADDQTAVMVRLARGAAGAPAPSPTGDGEEETFDLPWDVAGFAILRERVGEAARGLGADAAARLVLAAFEVATNVARHVPPPSAEAALTCRIRRGDDRTAVEIWYLGLPFEPGPVSAPDVSNGGEGGFGLFLIENAVSEVSYEHPVLDVCCTRLVQRRDSGAGAVS